MQKCYYWCLCHGFFVFMHICTSGRLQRDNLCLCIGLFCYLIVFQSFFLSLSKSLLCVPISTIFYFLMHLKVFLKNWQYFIIKRIPNGCIKWLNKRTKSNNLFSNLVFTCVCVCVWESFFENHSALPIFRIPANIVHSKWYMMMVLQRVRDHVKDTDARETRIHWIGFSSTYITLQKQQQQQHHQSEKKKPTHR